MFDEKRRFVIEDYQNQPPFSSFLPGIAGETGIPAWCYYNNRGQAVCSFGAMDKDHAIMEFSPAHVAYRDVSRTGFRTFCKVDGDYRELFTQNCTMHIGMSELEITTSDKEISASALYFGIPGEPIAALARILTIGNTSLHSIEIELLDGMPAVVPYGLNQDFLKNMTQLSKAWMQSEDHEKGHAYYRVRASLEDSAIVREVTGGNFCLGWDETGTLLKPLVQPWLVFGEDTSLAYPQRFQSSRISELTSVKQVTSNQFLCCFLPKITLLSPGSSLSIYSIYGQAHNKELVSALSQRIVPEKWFTQKRHQAQALVDKITSPILCKTGNPVFDAYSKQTFLDNTLRGGAPMIFRDGDNTAPFHIYSRKHGDPEREYNYFSLGMEYYAQGNGNYRDVNQNRRCDVLFAPEIGASNIYTFFDLIQTDGYNPLILTPATYTMPKEQQGRYLTAYPWLENILSSPFTPGKVALAAQNFGVSDEEIQTLTAMIVCSSEKENNADFGEGYWCDHWTYNLDLIESYLNVYPDAKKSLLFADNTCRWYETQVLVNPREKRYCMTENGLRQYYALDEHAKKTSRKWMHTADGQQASSSLIEKILLLCAIKTATLDASGMGIEMEGGRPGWYDALNGLPGLFGSSMAESCELDRLLLFTIEALTEIPGYISLYTEIEQLIKTVDNILQQESDSFRRWDSMNLCKERYRAETMYGFSGKRVTASSATLISQLNRMEKTVRKGIEKAIAKNNGIIPTYFTYSAVNVENNTPVALTPKVLPLFLEGPVRYLKLPFSLEEKRDLVSRVTQSGLYDKKLRMFKVNDRLSTVSYEAGRALAFTPGWLENESIWLHMEYKFLLELLKNGLYQEFSSAFHDAAVPFLNPKVYGRSPLENVSFIASSANPDERIHGRGFVARLSGSTAEFIHMWQIMFFGLHPFQYQDKELMLSFDPFIPSYLMDPTGILKATFLGKISVTYHTGALSELIPGVTSAEKYILTFADSHTETINGTILSDRFAKAVRDGSVRAIDIYMQ